MLAELSHTVGAPPPPPPPPPQPLLLRPPTPVPKSRIPNSNLQTPKSKLQKQDEQGTKKGVERSRYSNPQSGKRRMTRASMVREKFTRKFDNSSAPEVNVQSPPSRRLWRRLHCRCPPQGLGFTVRRFDLVFFLLSHTLSSDSAFSWSVGWHWLAVSCCNPQADSFQLLSHAKWLKWLAGPVPMVTKFFCHGNPWVTSIVTTALYQFATILLPVIVLLVITRLSGDAFPWIWDIFTWFWFWETAAATYPSFYFSLLHMQFSGRHSLEPSSTVFLFTLPFFSDSLSCTKYHWIKKHKMSQVKSLRCRLWGLPRALHLGGKQHYKREQNVDPTNQWTFNDVMMSDDWTNGSNTLSKI